ncbi:juvenile hormone acid O-methyltransferase-like [Saccoglossus kowalevskii]|uniref:Uncharacterized protein LOC102803287 n=1 Tax=Saccoglossus kowalevskii TaxID=10224 RepID=A0ABM0MWX6_SACKO|nr:PREDICTED: uncharacterized protein LOC102803287 [Saccoglossus kowalevskii]
MQTLTLLDGHWKDGDVVLNVGCGTGNETIMIVEMDNVSSVIGNVYAAPCAGYTPLMQTFGTILSGHDFEQPTSGYTLALSDGHWKDGDVVLDVGCGTGDETKLIAEMDNVSSVIGVDISPQMIEYAKTQHVISKKVEYIQGDVCRLVEEHPQLSNHFTKVVSFSCFNWFENQKDALKNVSACLSDGGECAIHMSYKSNPVHDANVQMNRHEQWKDQLQGFNDGLYLYPGSPAEFAEVVKTCGFTDVKCYSDDVITKMHSTEDMKDSFRAILGQLNVIPPNQHEDFLQDWLHVFDKINSHDGSETRIYNIPSLFVWARK